MNRRGMTLLEIMVAITILTLILGSLFTVAQSLSETTKVQNARITAGDEARRGMQFLVKELRQASRQSIAWGDLPTTTLSYRVPVDADGNGSAVDVNGNIELSDPRTIQADADDLNGDGLTTSQLILIDGTTVRVLANNLTTGGADLTAGPSGGIVFAQSGSGLEITIATEASAGKRMMPSGFSETVVPRN